LTEVQSPRSTTGVDVGASAEPSRGKDCLDYGSPGGYPPGSFHLPFYPSPSCTRSVVGLDRLTVRMDNRVNWPGRTRQSFHRFKLLLISRTNACGVTA
jgi:hypothetical protein